MALQRPIPPPRRKKPPIKSGDEDLDSTRLSSISTSTEYSSVLNSNSADSSIINAHEEKSMEHSLSNSLENSTEIHSNCMENSISSANATCGDNSVLDDSGGFNDFSDHSTTTESPATNDSKSRFNSVSVMNPSYESRTLPIFRPSRSLWNSGERTSNLIWLKSGVPAEFTVKPKEEELAATPSGYSPLDEPSNLPAPPIEPIFPNVPSLYPKLPPSPILPESSNVFAYASSSTEKSYQKSETELSSSGNPPPPVMNGSMTADYDGLSSQDSMVASGYSANHSALETFEDDEEEKFRDSITCKLEIQQSLSIDGSVCSNPSDTAMGSSGEQLSSSEIRDPGQPEVSGNNERLKLMPIGTNVCNAGWLNKLGQKKKETVRRWCVLKNGKFDIFNDDTSDAPLESIACKSMEMIYVRSPADLGNYDGDATFVFTISYLGEGKKLDSWTFSADLHEDYLVWMTLLTKCVVQSEASDLCEAVDRAGPLYLKKGTTADWEPGWFIMRGKVLLYAAEGDGCCYEVDIRKVIRIRTIMDANDCCPTIHSQVPFAFVVSTEGSALYAQSQDAVTSRAWKDAIELKLLERTGLISEQRLTTDDIPIIVEKCISFVAVHGLNEEGVYRHNGTLTKAKVLFELFMKDPQALHLRPREYSVHDVTSVLKKYFRQLDDPLITSALRPRFIEKSGLTEHGSRIMAYKRLLSELPKVNYNTLRKLLRHLKVISQHADKNMMTIQNLSAIFGPTLFSVERELVEEGNGSFVSASQAIKIIADMIMNYDDLFNVDSSELRKEREIENALKRIENHNFTKAPSQLLLSIHVLEKDANVFNMQINNKVTAGEVCSFAVAHRRLPHAAFQLALFEVVCNGQLERIVNSDEKLLDIVSRWSSWPVDERATNYVIVKPDTFKQRLESMSTSSLLTSCDVQLSETKSFRKCTLQCSKGEILVYKNAKGTKPLQSWSIDKILWYFGCEAKRQPPSKFNLTFVDRDAIIRRNKSAPFFGRCISFHDESDLLKWLTTVTLSNKPLPTDF